MKYFLYIHIRQDNGEVFYVGIGTINKSFSEKSKYARAYSKITRNNLWKKIVSKTSYDIKILLESDNRQEVINKEIELIKFYGKKCNNTGTLVNLTDGGEGSVGYKCSEESKRKMSLAKKGKKKNYIQIFTKERRDRMSKAASQKKGILNNFYGKHHTEEAKLKMSKSVIQLTLEGDKIREFSSIKEAATLTNSKSPLIVKVCKGERRSHNNYIWKYC